MIKTSNITKKFINGPVETSVLKGIDLHIKEGEFVAIMGRSGAGKSTLMYQLSLLDEPSGGEIFINGNDTHNMTEDQRTLYRLKNLGYVFQEYALLPDLTALENVAVPILMQGYSKEESFARSRESLTRIGLGDRLDNLPSQLSGGEQQRVSVARAIVNRPEILFADEPTANLDNDSAQVVIDLFKELHKEGQTIVMVTHERFYGEQADRIIFIDDGRIVKGE